MRRPPSPRLQSLYDAARARPVRGIAAALLICAGGLALRGAERLLDIDAGAVLAAANERATERKHTPRKETPS